MRADRDKRAAILSAEGEKQAAILSAEGGKQAAVLRARGEAEAAVMRAKADAESQALRAKGEADAITTVFRAIHEGRPDTELLAYQYLQMLPQIAQGDSNKIWIIPSELGKALEGLGGFFPPGAGSRERGWDRVESPADVQPPVQRPLRAPGQLDNGAARLADGGPAANGGLGQPTDGAAAKLSDGAAG